MRYHMVTMKTVLKKKAHFRFQNGDLMDFSTQSKMPVLPGIDKVKPSIGIGLELTIVGQWSCIQKIQIHMKIQIQIHLQILIQIQIALPGIDKVKPSIGIGPQTRHRWSPSPSSTSSSSSYLSSSSIPTMHCNITLVLIAKAESTRVTITCQK